MPFTTTEEREDSADFVELKSRHICLQTLKVQLCLIKQELGPEKNKTQQKTPPLHSFTVLKPSVFKKG